MVDINKAIIDLVNNHTGISLTPWKKKITPEIIINLELGFFKEEAEELMDNFFTKFNVSRNQFRINSYFQENLGFFKRNSDAKISDLKVSMLIESAKAGQWLFH